MMRALFTAASGMQAQQRNIDTVANNLANVNTTGFKKSKVHFQDLLYQNEKSAGGPSSLSTQVPVGLHVGHGVKYVSTEKMHSQGGMENTERELDIGIDGPGYFQILQPNGIVAYTRDGHFNVDGQGRLVTSDGLLVDPEINIPIETRKVEMGFDGTISIYLRDETLPEAIGSLTLVRFRNPSGMTPISKNLYIPTAASGNPLIDAPGSNGMGTLNQGFLELSNVSLVEEMVDMITAQRAYEVNSKAIQASDEMLQTANNLTR
ncbi:MAG TPA: flagellar basal-body rod protein FlgG [Deltaproteobacteria bacterium]|nr:flagellar basal-body rod protein FlgG [Deltaproteobacteria bacterium]